MANCLKTTVWYQDPPREQRNIEMDGAADGRGDVETRNNSKGRTTLEDDDWPIAAKEDAKELKCQITGLPRAEVSEMLVLTAGETTQVPGNPRDGHDGATDGND